MRRSVIAEKHVDINVSIGISYIIELNALKMAHINCWNQHLKYPALPKAIYEKLQNKERTKMQYIQIFYWILLVSDKKITDQEKTNYPD